MPLAQTLADADYCYVTTKGRVTGRPHTVEIWFAAEGDTIYILAGGGHTSDWVKNAKKQPRVPVRIKRTRFAGRARIVSDRAEDRRARRVVVAKYRARGHDGLQPWGRTALPVAIKLTPSRATPAPRRTK